MVLSWILFFPLYQHYKYAQCLYNLADLERKSGAYREALERYDEVGMVGWLCCVDKWKLHVLLIHPFPFKTQSRDILSDVLGPYHSEVAEVRVDCIVLLLLSRVLSYSLAIVVNNDLSLVHFMRQVIQNSGRVYKKSGNYAKAMGLYQEAQKVTWIFSFWYQCNEAKSYRLVSYRFSVCVDVWCGVVRTSNNSKQRK